MITSTACQKTEETKNCQNGGHGVLDACICADGYLGEFCETTIAYNLYGTYNGTAKYNDTSAIQDATMVVEPHPNNDPRSIQIFKMMGNNKEYLTDSRVLNSSNFSSLHNIGSYEGVILVTGHQPWDSLSIAFKIYYQKNTGSYTTLVNFSGSKQ